MTIISFVSQCKKHLKMFPDSWMRNRLNLEHFGHCATKEVLRQCVRDSTRKKSIIWSIYGWSPEYLLYLLISKDIFQHTKNEALIALECIVVYIRKRKVCNTKSVNVQRLPQYFNARWWQSFVKKMGSFWREKGDTIWGSLSYTPQQLLSDIHFPLYLL